MTELAHLHGEQGWRTHMFPLSVDGIEVVASLVLLADKRASRRSGLLPWAALIAGTTASFAANVAVGGIDIIGRAVSGWPAFALLIAVKLLFGLLDHPASAGNAAPVEPIEVDVPDRPATLCQPPRTARTPCRTARTALGTGRLATGTTGATRGPPRTTPTPTGTAGPTATAPTVHYPAPSRWTWLR